MNHQPTDQPACLIRPADIRSETLTAALATATATFAQLAEALAAGDAARIAEWAWSAAADARELTEYADKLDLLYTK